MKIRMMLTAVLSVILVCISWIGNFGFVRLCYTVMLIPFIHAIVVLADSACLTLFASHKRIRIYNFLFCMTYLLSNVFLPDMNETEIYMFFGLIKDSDMCKIGVYITGISFVVHIGLIIIQIAEVIRLKRKQTAKEEGK